MEVLQSTIGWQRSDVRVNSLAPAMSLASTASAAAVFEPRLPSETPLSIPDIQHAQPRKVSQRASGIPLNRMFSSLESTRFAPDQESALRRARALHKSPQIVVTADASDYAATLRVRDDVNIALRLVLRIVPGASGVQVSIVHDMEDGTTNFRLKIRTSATIGEVLDAEDDVHGALFDRLRPSARSLFTVSYDFVPRQPWTHWIS